MRSGFGEHAAIRCAWLLVALVACQPANATAPQTTSTLVVTRGTFTQRLVLTGDVDAADSLNFSGPRTDDWNLSIRWLATDGAQIKAGDRVVGFDAAAVTDRVRELEISVTEAGSAIVEQAAKSDIEVEDKVFEVDKQRTALAKADLDASVPAHLLSRREAHNFALAKARAEVALATAMSDAKAAKTGAALEAEVKRIAYDKALRGLKSADLQLDGLDLLAPRDGIFIVAEHPWEGRKLQIGDNVFPGLTVARLPDLSQLIVRARLDDVDDGRVLPGQSATCYVDAWPDTPLSAHIVAVSGVAQEVTMQSTRRYFTVAVEIDGEPPGAMLPGLSVRVEVDTRTIDDALLVPRAAIAFEGDKASARLADGSSVEIAIEACDGQRCAISSGLDEGTALAPISEAK